MAFQILFSLFILFILSRVFVRYRENILSVQELVVWSLFWVTALTLIIFPEIPSLAAYYLGIGRGVDLAIYSAILLLFYGFFRVLVRLDTVEREITQLVRKNALDDPERGGEGKEL